MPRGYFKSLADRIARKCGYVPVADFLVMVDTKDKAEATTRHKVKNLEQQIMYRDTLERELQLLRENQKLQADNNSGLQLAVGRLDAIGDRLAATMREIRQDYHMQDDTAEYAPLTAVSDVLPPSAR